jgi:hypothetical protein
MSGFLATLVARSVAAPTPIPVMRPRVPSRFEPDAGSSSPSPVVSEIETAIVPPRPAPPVKQDDPLRDVQSREQSTPPPAGRAHSGSPRDDDALDVARPSRPTRGDASAAGVPLPTPAGAADSRDAPDDERSSQSLTRSPVDGRHEGAAPKTTVRVERLVAPPVPSPSAVEHPDASETRPRPAAAASIHDRTVDAAPMPSHAADAAPAPRPAVTAMRVVVAEPARQPPMARPQEPPRAPGPADEPSTVHVTIGRLEIRAVQARPEPGRRAAPPPPLSLEDYVARRRREGGGGS